MMKFLDQSSLLDAIQDELNSSKLTFQTVNESVLSFTMQLPLYLNTPQENPEQTISAQISELESLRKTIFD